MVPLSEFSLSVTQPTRKLRASVHRRSTILNAVKGRLSQATPADNHACFLDACIEAMDQYA